MAEENKETMDQLKFDEPEDGGLTPIDIPDEEEMHESGEEEIENEEEENALEPTAVNIPIDVIEEAVGYGLTTEDIEKLGTEENISAVLSILDRQDGISNSIGSPAALGNEDDDDFDPFGEETAQTHAVENEEMAALRSQVDQLTKMVTSQKANIASKEKLFDNLSSEYDELFGEVGDDLSDTQRRNRERVVTEMDTIRAGYKARKRHMPSDRRLMTQAIGSVYGDHETKVQRKKFSDSVKKRQGQFISRVNARDNRGLKDGRNTAIDSVKAFLADKGYADFSSTENFD